MMAFSMFMQDLASPIATGTLALLYDTLRGGRSGNGVTCGVFSVFAYSSFSAAHWGYGAALSFKSNVL